MYNKVKNKVFYCSKNHRTYFCNSTSCAKWKQFNKFKEKGKKRNNKKHIKLINSLL